LVFAGHPFDLIKVRLQTDTQSQYKGALDCAKQTIQRDGFRGLYRGMSVPLVGIVPIFAVCFWAYDLGEKIARKVYGQGPTDKLSMGQIAFAGGFSAVPTTAIMAPGERIKVLLQIEGQNREKGIPPKYSGPIDVVKKLAKEGGIRSIYKGTGATLARDVPGSVAYFAAYELFRRILTPKGGNPNDLNPLVILFAGGMAGVCNWSVCIPPDVVKSRYQTAPEGTYRNTWHVVTSLVKDEGIKGLFKGIGPAMARAFPANAACFLGREVSLKFLNRLW